MNLAKFQHNPSLGDFDMNYERVSFNITLDKYWYGSGYLEDVFSISVSHLHSKEEHKYTEKTTYNK